MMMWGRAPMADTYPILKALVGAVKCKPGWGFRMASTADGLRVIIRVAGHDSYDGHTMTIDHYFAVPPTTYNLASWRRWLFDQCRRVENHELGEWFRIDDVRHFAPCHGPGEDPYTVHEYRHVDDSLVTQDGSMRAARDQPELPLGKPAA